MRRFGGGFQTNGSGDIRIASIGLWLLVIFSFVALAFDEALFVIFGFFSLFIFSIISVSSSKGTVEEVGQKRMLMHIAKAIEYYDLKQYELAKGCFDKAKKYGEIPSQYASCYNDLKYKLSL